MLLCDRAFVDKVQSVAVTQPPAAHRLTVHGQTTHNVLLYLIRLFNYKPLANCRSSWLLASCLPSESTVKSPLTWLPSHSRVRRVRYRGPPPAASSLSHGRCCVDAACGDGERELGQWVSDSMH